MIADVETFRSVLLSPPHILAEVTFTLVTDGVLYPFARYALKRHDRKHHKESV
jgi:heme/copper-type cytochrome/quinol oxidase subunit 3